MEKLIERLKENIAEIQNQGDRTSAWQKGRLSAFRGVLKQMEEMELELLRELRQLHNKVESNSDNVIKINIAKEQCDLTKKFNTITASDIDSIIEALSK